MNKSSSFRPETKTSLFSIKSQRLTKQEEIKALQRNYNYKMRVLSKRKKQKIQHAQKQRKRTQYCYQNKQISDKLSQLKRIADENEHKKKQSLRQSVEYHRRQKMSNQNFLRLSNAKQGILGRYQSNMYHQQLQAQNKKIITFKRRQYQKQKKRQNEKKAKQQQRIIRIKEMSKSTLEGKILNEYEKIQLAQALYHFKKQMLNQKIKKAANQYYSLSFY